MNLTFTPKALDEKMMKIYMTMLRDPSKDRDILEDKTLGQEFFVQILIKRIRAYKLPFKVTSFFIIMCIGTFVDRPGVIMILLRLMYQHWKDTGTRTFDAKVFGEMFPWGVPDENSLEKMWDSQKDFSRRHVSDNFLDNPKNWK